MNRHIITDKERGHRKPLSPNEPTVIYTIKMPLSLKERCIRKGAEWVRKMLERTCKTCSQWAKKTNRCVMDGTYIYECSDCEIGNPNPCTCPYCSDEDAPNHCVYEENGTECEWILAGIEGKQLKKDFPKWK